MGLFTCDKTHTNSVEKNLKNFGKKNLKKLKRKLKKSQLCLNGAVVKVLASYFGFPIVT